MRKNTRALVATVMTLGAIATAYAGPPMSYGEAESFSSNPMPSQPSMTTRAEVKADLKDARANGTLPRYSEGSYGDMAAPNTTASTLTRAEVRQQAREATRADFHAHVSTPDN
ncbi:MAG TPA: DUF4148 domain-containing protein [Alicycliphilus sp.]|nr:DUF4148 domain-containing protein [Alicycliphilus sp.]